MGAAAGALAASALSAGGAELSATAVCLSISIGLACEEVGAVQLKIEDEDTDEENDLDVVEGVWIRGCVSLLFSLAGAV